MRLDSPLGVYVPKFRTIGEQLTVLLKERYEIEVPSYEVSTIHLHFDLVGKLNPQPAAFLVERRLNVPYSHNVWFAQAPLRTTDHVAILQKLESLGEE